MRTKTITLAASLALAFAAPAFAQTPAGGGSAEGNMNNPGSVKSNEEKRDERATGSATGGPTAAPGAGTSGTGVGTGGAGGGGGVSGGGAGAR